LHWLRVVYLLLYFSEDTCLDLVYHVMQMHHSKFYLLVQNFLLLDIWMFAIPLPSVSTKFDLIACVEHTAWSEFN